VLQRLSDTALDWLFPPRCVVRGCGRRGAWLCAACLAAVRPPPAPLCARCGAPCAGQACGDCAALRPAFERAVAAGLYEPPLRDAIQALKYGGVRTLARPLGRLAAVPLRLRLAPPADALLVPVPSHHRRAASRGLDHTVLLVAELARSTGTAASLDLLTRPRATRPQVGLTPAGRRANVAGAFAVRGRLDGRTVVLVDDVLTTGATASACAEALAAAGAARVLVCTVARAAR
jgi:ComF family protein